MALANTKKAATIRNLWWQRVAKPIQEANAVVAAIRAAIVDEDLVPEFSSGERDAMQAVETALAALAALGGIAAAEGKHIPGHTTEPETVGLEV